MTTPRHLLPLGFLLPALVLIQAQSPLQAETLLSQNRTCITFGPGVPAGTVWKVSYVKGEPDSPRNLITATEQRGDLLNEQKLSGPGESFAFVAYRSSLRLGVESLSFKPNYKDDGCRYTIRLTDEAGHWVEFQVEKPDSKWYTFASSRWARWTLGKAEAGPAKLKAAADCFAIEDGNLTINKARLPW